MHVRHLDWEESHALGRLQEAQQSGDAHGTGAVKANLQNQIGSSRPAVSTASFAPCVAVEEEFEVVIGTDILYEVRFIKASSSCCLWWWSTTPVNYVSLSPEQVTVGVFTGPQADVGVTGNGVFAGSSLQACGCCVEAPSDHPWTSSYLLCSQGPGQ